jgi:1,4-dihydroxy-6-naphthoate synthase
VTARVRIGLSTCPNDTFAFHALLTGAVTVPELEPEFVLADVEELNRAMLAGELDLAKTSYHAMLAMSERVLVLPVGSALGFGVGPLLLAAPGRALELPLPRGSHVLVPGRWTTAALLFRLLHPSPTRVEETVFSAILPRLAGGSADHGVCIHEARFTWRDHGLGLVADLGTLWEERTGKPLPLGGLCARRELGAATIRSLVRAVRASLQWGLANRAACLPTMRRHAQEHSDAVLWSHVDLYVNDWTLDLGERGRQALDALRSIAEESGLVSRSGRALEIANG